MLQDIWNSCTDQNVRKAVFRKFHTPHHSSFYTLSLKYFRRTNNSGQDIWGSIVPPAFCGFMLTCETFGQKRISFFHHEIFVLLAVEVKSKKHAGVDISVSFIASNLLQCLNLMGKWYRVTQNFNKHLDRIGKSSTLKSALLQCWPKNYSPGRAFNGLLSTHIGRRFSCTGIIPKNCRHTCPNAWPSHKARAL